jgi:hypothetical protein
MESDDELQLFSPTEEPSPAVPEPKLKRLKKAVRVSSDIPTLNPSSPPVDFSKSEAVDSDESKGRDSPELNESPQPRAKRALDSGEDELDSGGFDGLGGEEDSSRAKRALEFDSVAEEFDGEGEDLRAERGEGLGGLRAEEPEKKRRSPVEMDEKRENKKKKRNKRVAKSVNAQETATAKRITQKVIYSLSTLLMNRFSSSSNS